MSKYYIPHPLTSYSEILELPSIKSRFKVSEGMLHFGKENQIFDEISTDRDRSESSELRMKGACNYLQLIQLAVTILYSSRTIFDNTNELKQMKNQNYNFQKDDFDCLFLPIKKSIENAGDKPDEEMNDHMVDWISKMLKYQQIFGSNGYGVFKHWFNSFISISSTRSEKLTLAWTVFLNLVVTNPKHPVIEEIPSFLKLFNEEVKNSAFGSEKERDAFRAIKILKMVDISSDITKEQSFESLAKKYSESHKIDFDSQDYDEQVNTSWIDSWIKEFNTLWKDFIDKKSIVDHEDVSLSESKLKMDSIYKKALQMQGNQNDLLKKLVGKMQKTSAESANHSSGLQSASLIESSIFSLDQASMGDSASNSQDVDEQSMMEYLRNHTGQY